MLLQFNSRCIYSVTFNITTAQDYACQFYYFLIVSISIFQKFQIDCWFVYEIVAINLEVNKKSERSLYLK